MFLTNSKSLGENFIKLIGLMLLLTVWSAGANAQLTVDAEAYAAGSIISVPPGNRFPTTPTIPETVWQSIRRKALESPDQAFYGALKVFAKNNYARDLARIAPLYGVTPLQVLGAVMGEHTFNTTLVDYAQGVYINMVPGWLLTFRNNNTNLADLLRQAPFQECSQHSTSYMMWVCYQNVWQKSYRGRNGFSAKSLKFAFFDPVFAGHTFGIGQLDPVRALMVADKVARVRGLPPISIANPEKVYSAILDTESNTHYIAANIAAIIAAYRQIAHFDISKNVGVIATLYNLGSEYQRAHELAAKNAKHLAKGERLQWPVENFYGWYINDKEKVLRKWLADNGAGN